MASDKSNDKELSMDDLKDVSGGGLASVSNELGGWVRKGDEDNSTVQIGLQDNSSAPRSKMDSTGGMLKIKFQDTGEFD